MRLPDPEFWRGRRVFVTGHMGFKGAWLCAILARLGAKTFGYGFDERSPLLYRELTVDHHVSIEGDVTDLPALAAALKASNAEVLFHLAAQPIVLKSYDDPVETFRTNVLGTVNVLEAARSIEGMAGIVIVTSDKVYLNNGAGRPFAEHNHLGGDDPYSASKAAAEVTARAMASSFLSGERSPGVATARSGNVIGGGDWADHRLLPDAARALSRGQQLLVRNPMSTRPWLHVLDSLNGYLLLAERLCIRPPAPFASWNLGPASAELLLVSDVADLFVSAWGDGASWTAPESAAGQRHEAPSLQLDSTKARGELGWSPRWTGAEAVGRTAAWYRDRASGIDARTLVERDLGAFLALSA